MNTKRIQGKTAYQTLETGFWSIIGNDGQKWRPINFPEQLKLEGADVSLTVEVLEEGVSIFMWGKPVRILSFHTLNP